MGFVLPVLCALPGWDGVSEGEGRRVGEGGRSLRSGLGLSCGLGRGLGYPRPAWVRVGPGRPGDWPLWVGGEAVGWAKGCPSPPSLPRGVCRRAARPG